MIDREELEKLSSKELHDRAMHLAEKRVDVGFLWSLFEAIPAAEAAAGNLGEAKADVLSLIRRLSDLVHSGQGNLADALRPFFLDYLEEHG